MTRYIEIHDGEEIQHLTNDEFPLIINIITKNDKKSIVIEEFKEQLDTLQGYKSGEVESLKCAYIAEHENHIYFQPENNNVKIFHNDERIETSVWLKSGDVLRIEDTILSYSLSGDCIVIIISYHTHKVIFIPPVSAAENPILEDPGPENQLSENQSSKNLSSKKDESKKTSNKKQHSFKKAGIISALLLLLITAGFILFAETISIKIEPQTEQIQFKGLLPTIRMGERYIGLAGQYELIANKTGYITLHETVNVNKDNNSFTFHMEEKPGILEFNINPQLNNKIYIDEAQISSSMLSDSEQSKTPSYKVKKGVHQLKIINPRYKILEKEINVEGKDIVQQFNFTLEANWGVVKLSTVPENSTIEIISKQSENSAESKTREVLYSPAEIELMAGSYELLIKKDKYKTKTIEINIKAHEQLIMKDIPLELQEGTLIINSNPKESIIRIDGEFFGKTPKTIKVTPNVQHEIEVSSSAYENKTSIVKLDPQQVKEINLTLKRKQGMVYIATSPKGAVLYIDGYKQKKSSGKFTLSEGSHTISAKAKGYKNQTKKIDINSNSKNIKLILNKSSSRAKKKETKVSAVTAKKINKKTYINSIGQKMILLQPGLFKMGSAKNVAGRRSNELDHKVKIDYAYYLSEKEISNKQFRRYKGSHNSGMIYGQSLNINNQPVVNVSWNDAAKFSNWLSKKEGLALFYKEVNGEMVAINLKGHLTKKNNGYRLPFESEWSFAARGNSQSLYPWTGKFPPAKVTGNFCDESAPLQLSVKIKNYNDHHAVTAPTGSYAKNNLGFFDLGGNVSEWCQDYYSPYSMALLSSNKISINPTGPKKGTHKVVRDSSWKDASITELRLSYRNYSRKAAEDIGFRIARHAN